MQSSLTTSIIQNAIKTENPPQLHGWVYDIKEGLLKDLEWKDEDFASFKEIYNIEC